MTSENKKAAPSPEDATNKTSREETTTPANGGQAGRAEKTGQQTTAVELMKAEAESATAEAEGLVVVDAAVYVENDPPPLDPIIEGVFERGDKGELVAGSKQRKTFFLILLFLHLAIGRDFLNFKIPKRRRVVWVNMELKESWGWRRIHKLARTEGIQPDELRGWFFVVNARSKGKAVRAAIDKVAVKIGADVVGLDPRYKLHILGEAENASEGLQGILDLIDRIAEAGPAVLTVHHDAKGDNSEKSVADRGSGSGTAGRDDDFKFTLSAQRDEPETAAVVESMRRNYPPEPPFSVRWTDDRFELAEDLSPVKYGAEDRKRAAQAKPTMEDCEPVILAVAAVVMGKQELIAKVAGQVKRASRDNIRAAIDSLVRTGRLAHTPRAGHKNGIVRYGTPEAVREYLNPRLTG